MPPWLLAFSFILSSTEANEQLVADLVRTLSSDSNFNCLHLAGNISLNEDVDIPIVNNAHNVGCRLSLAQVESLARGEEITASALDPQTKLVLIVRGENLDETSLEEFFSKNIRRILFLAVVHKENQSYKIVTHDLKRYYYDYDYY